MKLGRSSLKPTEYKSNSVTRSSQSTKTFNALLLSSLPFYPSLRRVSQFHALIHCHCSNMQPSISNTMASTMKKAPKVPGGGEVRDGGREYRLFICGQLSVVSNMLNRETVDDWPAALSDCALPELSPCDTSLHDAGVIRFPRNPILHFSANWPVLMRTTNDLSRNSVSETASILKLR